MIANKFEEIAKAMSESGKVKTDLELSDLKAKRDQINKMFDFKISELELIQNEQKQASEQAKAEQKQNKIKTDLIKSMLDSGEGQATGGQSTSGVFTGREEAAPMNQGQLPQLAQAAAQ